MNIAIVLDCISDNTIKLINYIDEKNDVCIFLPEGTNYERPNCMVRYYTQTFDIAAFQRYDVAVFMAEEDWEKIFTFIECVKGAVVISSEDSWYKKISEYTEYITDKPDRINVLLSSMPPYIMWFDRSEKEIMSRVKSMGLATEKFIETYYQVYSYEENL